MVSIPTRGAVSEKRKEYGRARKGRRRMGAVVFVLVALLAVALPLVLWAPDAAEEAWNRYTHPLEYEGTIRAATAEYGVEPTLVAAVIRAESRFDPVVESPQGAYGLMQILPDTADFIAERSGIKGDYRDPETNIRMGTWYLSYLQGRYEGDERLVLAAYNSGEGRVDGWLQEGRDIAGGDIPFEETREYVERVVTSKQVYGELYGRDLSRPRT